MINPIRPSDAMVRAIMRNQLGWLLLLVLSFTPSGAEYASDELPLVLLALLLLLLVLLVVFVGIL